MTEYEFYRKHPKLHRLISFVWGAHELLTLLFGMFMGAVVMAGIFYLAQ